MAAESQSVTESPLFAPGVFGAALVGCYVISKIAGLPVGLLAAAACALSLVISLVWQSLSHLSDEADLTLDEAFSLAAPIAEEEQKRAVLRTLKDLEYELRVGKISQADFVELSARYREEAKRLIVAVDERLAEQRAHAERLLDERLNPKTQPSPTSDAEEQPKKRKKKASASASVKKPESTERPAADDSDDAPTTKPGSDQVSEAQSERRDDQTSDDAEDSTDGEENSK